jgi:hypothetical protein
MEWMDVTQGVSRMMTTSMYDSGEVSNDTVPGYMFHDDVGVATGCV